jgi:DNA repair exonuclease SbcCD nuclease subunit
VALLFKEEKMVREFFAKIFSLEKENQKVLTKQLRIKPNNILIIDGENLAGNLRISEEVLNLYKEIEEREKILRERKNEKEKVKEDIKKAIKEKRQRLEEITELFAKAIMVWITAIGTIGRTEQFKPKTDIILLTGMRVVYTLYKSGKLWEKINKEIERNRYKIIVPNTENICRGLMDMKAAECDDIYMIGLTTMLYSITENGKGNREKEKGNGKENKANQSSGIETFGKFIRSLPLQSIADKLLTMVESRLIQGEEGIVIVSNDNLIKEIFKGKNVMYLMNYEYAKQKDEYTLTIPLKGKTYNFKL